MGNAGKVEEQERARALRAQAWTLAEIAAELGVSRSSVSLWVRDVPFEPRPRNRGNGVTRPHPLHLARMADIAAARTEAEGRIGGLSERELFLAGLTLYAGEGFKTGNVVGFANTDPRLVLFFLVWLRRCFEVEEARLRARLYLHADLELASAETYWSGLTGIPPAQFIRPYRAAVGPKRGTRRHVRGCLTVRYSDVRLLRRITALHDALLSFTPFIPG